MSGGTNQGVTRRERGSNLGSGILLIVVALVISLVALVLAFTLFTTDDDFGKVDVPGSGTVHLPEGKVGLIYSEQVQLAENEGFHPPDDLEVKIVPEGGGEAVDYEAKESGGSQSNVGNSAKTSLSSAQIPAEGDYEVVTAGSPRNFGANVQFGKGTLYAFTHGVPRIFNFVALGFLALGILVAVLPGRRRAP